MLYLILIDEFFIKVNVLLLISCLNVFFVFVVMGLKLIVCCLCCVSKFNNKLVIWVFLVLVFVFVIKNFFIFELILFF